MEHVFCLHVAYTQFTCSRINIIKNVIYGNEIKTCEKCTRDKETETLAENLPSKFCLPRFPSDVKEWWVCANSEIVIF
jgi:hypothetical protein